MVEADLERAEERAEAGEKWVFRDNKQSKYQTIDISI